MSIWLTVAHGSPEGHLSPLGHQSCISAGMALLKAFSALFFTVLISQFCVSDASAKLNLLSQVDTQVWRGSQPKTAADFEKLRELGIKVIINIQRKDDKLVAPEKAMAESLSFRFIHIPVDSREMPSDDVINKILATLQDGTNQPVYLHCTLGRDRTGLIFSLYRVLVQKWTPAAAYKEWTALGFSSRFLKNLDKYFRNRTGYSEPTQNCAVDLAAIPAA